MMKPSNITAIMDTALLARKIGEVFNPLFTGDAGLGKSQIVQQWVKQQKERNPEFGFIDLRIAYMEAPDLIGFPETQVDENGIVRTFHRLPSFWPTKGEGLILLEEPNRGTSGVMNCLMQLLTDRKIHQYSLPDGWMIAGCINPDSSEYDVNAMDTALKDRFEEFEIEYDSLAFLEYMEREKWADSIQRFIGNGLWIFKSAKDLGADAKYISPRTWSKVNAAEKTSIIKNRALHRIVVTSILGKDMGNDYHVACYDQAPVSAQDILRDKEASLKKLQSQSSVDNYNGDMIVATVDSIIKAYGGDDKDCPEDKIPDSLMIEIANVIPADQALNLIKGCAVSRKNYSSYFAEITKKYPKLMQNLQASVKLQRAVESKK